MKELSFRAPNVNDIESLTVLMEQLGYPITPSQMRENILRHSSLEHQRAWVAVMNQKVIGCIAVTITHYFHREGSFLRVITMVVDQNKRRMGIGKKLMQLAEEYAKEKGCSHIELTSGAHREILGSHTFYVALGYTDLNSQKKYFGKKL